MPTPSLLALSPQSWTVAAAVCLGLLGMAVGRFTGRLVHLFGSARPVRAPDPRDIVRANGERAVSPGQDDAEAAAVRFGGASVEPPASPGDYDDHEDGPPPPRCPHCRAELPFVRGLPAVASRCFRHRGACPHCEQVLRPHVAVVVTTALLFALTGVLSAHQFHWFPFGHLAVLWLVAIGVLLSVIDVRVLRLPNDLVAPAYPVAGLLVAAAVLLKPGGPALGRGTDALVSMVLVTVLFWLMWRVYPKGLGFGDVKLSGLTGLYTGWAAGPLGTLVAVFWAFAAFSLLGVVLMALRRHTRRDLLPLGPFLIGATLATVLFGAPLVPTW